MKLPKNSLIDYVKQYNIGLYVLLILLLGTTTVSPGYNQPAELFWDENYHIASAQKYIDGVMFMEPHPPLGKMLLALGEYITQANQNVDTKNLLKTDYLQNGMKPKNLSFTGYRLVPVILMILTAVLFFFIVMNISNNSHIAFLSSLLLLFDNALVVHARSAMLESTQLFFMLAAILYFTLAIKKNRITLKTYLILASLIALVISVKVNGAILLLLLAFLFFYEQKEAIKNKKISQVLIRLVVTAPLSILSIAMVFLLFMYAHIVSGSKIENNQTYKASPAYQELITQGDIYSPTAFIVALKDNLKFMSEYADGVPKLDICKDGENGSLAVGWPLGTKTINYRWDKETIDGKQQASYLYLQSNPLVWITSGIGVLLSVSLLIGRFVYNAPVKDESLFWWITVFSTLYVSYMIAIIQIDRVMYLYHYFIPLMFALINLPLIFSYIFSDELIKQPKHSYINLLIFTALVIASFIHFSPFTYYQPLTEQEFQLRQWFDFWQLNSVTQK